MSVVQILALAWLCAGVGTAVVMARRGYDPVLWAVIGVLLGPAGAVVAVAGVRREDSVADRVVVAGTPAGGRIDVLVGVDGSEESLAAIHEASALFGADIGRLTLATVVDYDVAQNDVVASEFGDRLLARAARLVPHLTPELVLLPGEPAEALIRYALNGAFDVVVVGGRGPERNGVVGSVAARLAARSPLPVLVVSRSAVADLEEGERAWSAS